MHSFSARYDLLMTDSHKSIYTDISEVISNQKMETQTRAPEGADSAAC